MRAATIKVYRRRPREKFVELANKRVSRAIQALRLVGDPANRHNYENYGGKARKILRALRLELDAFGGRFRGGSGGDQTAFTL